MKKWKMYGRSLLLTLLVLCTFLLSGCDMFAEEEEDEGADVLYVYSWGDYLSEDVIKQFEEETGIKVVLDEYDTNESMYPRIAEGAEAYDVLCPSDYMINKLIHNDLLQPLDFAQLPNARKNIGQNFFANTAVRELVKEDLGEYVDTAFPSENVYKGQESYSYLGEALDKLYTKLWLQVKVE